VLSGGLLWQNVSRRNILFMLGKRNIAKFKSTPEIFNQMLSLICEVLNVLRFYFGLLKLGTKYLNHWLKVKQNISGNL